jgi:putative flippase GtrA
MNPHRADRTGALGWPQSRYDWWFVLSDRLQRLRRRVLKRRLARFAISSAVAATTSAVVFPILYVLGASTTACSVAAFAAGAIPNWTLNRRWTWKVEGRVAFGREILAYIAVSATTLLALSLATGWTHHQVQGIPAGHGVRVLLVTASYFGVLAVLYGLRYFLYEFWIFSGESRVRAALRSRRQVWMAARANRTP